MKISVFGLGYVGCVSIGCLARNGHIVIGVDVNETKVNQINSGKPTIIEKNIAELIANGRAEGLIRATLDYKLAVHESDLSVIAVGTPSSNNGHLNLDYLFTVTKQIAEAIALKDSYHVIIVRSTILPGTIKKMIASVESITGKERGISFDIVSNPEFLREGSAVYDYDHPPLTLIGSESEHAASIVADLYQHLPAKIVVTSIEVAEIMKYVNNTFHALKVSFANEVGNICQALNIDSHEVMDIFCMDNQLNISPYYFKPGFAYGGSCLPKDLKGLQTLAHDYYLKTPLLESIDKTNEIQIARSVQMVQQLGRKKISVLGISFKAGTDDLRNSPSVTLIEQLLGKGFHIRIYDKNVQLSRLTGTNKEYIDNHIPHLSVLMSENIEGLLEDAEVIIVNTKEKEYIVPLENLSDDIILIDMTRLPESIRSKPNCRGINW